MNYKLNESMFFILRKLLSILNILLIIIQYSCCKLFLTPKNWPNGLLPFTLDGDFTEEELINILDALNEIEEETCI